MTEETDLNSETVEDKKTDEHGSDDNEDLRAAEESDGSSEDESENTADDVSEDNELLHEISELKDKLLRERAEFSNYRRRSQAEKEKMGLQIAGEILEKMLPGMDAFDQFLSSGAKDESISEEAMNKIKEGVSMIQKQLWQVFEDQGVKAIEPEDEAFDPSKMEALSVTESDTVDEETVQQVYQRGFLLNDRVLRPARVAVLKPSAGESNNSEKEKE